MPSSTARHWLAKVCSITHELGGQTRGTNHLQQVPGAQIVPRGWCQLECPESRGKELWSYLELH